MDWALAVRLLNSAGCLFVLWILATSAFRQWHSWTYKTKGLWCSLAGWVFLGLDLEIEMIILDTDPGPRTLVQTLATGITIWALLKSGDINASEEVPWKKKDEK